jgi:single-strand DNA-binding protein
MNSVILIGRLTRKPELRYSNSGNQTAIGRFTLAVDRQKKDDGADFINIVVFGKQAENCERYLDKGRQVAVQGRIQTGSYKTQTGETRYTTEVVADRVEFLSNGERSGAPAGGQQYGGQSYGGGQGMTGGSDFGGIPEGFQSVSDDDIPF